MPFEDQVDGRVEQWMARADERRQRLPGRRDQDLFRRRSARTGQDGLPDADQTVSITDRRRNMGDLVAARFTLLDRAAEAPECLQEKRFDVVRLEASRLGSLHVFANPMDADDIHAVMRKRPILKEFLNVCSVERILDDRLRRARTSGLLAVADGFDQQFAQRAAFELKLAEHVEHLSAEGLPLLLQLFEEAPVDIAFAGFVRHQIPEVADFGLADAVNAPEPLFQPVRVPRQVVIDHQMRALQVDAFACRVGGQQDLNFRVVPERFLRLHPLLAAHAAMDRDDRFRAPEQGRDARLGGSSACRGVR